MKKKYLSFLLLISLLTNSYSQLTTTVNPSIGDLTNYFQGIGLTISNLTVTAAPGSYGFYSGISNMAFGNGIIMSTGQINNSINNPPSALYTADNHAPGDPLIDVITGTSSFDGCVIEFDCVPTNSTLFFDYAFGSEEYNEYVGSPFNDAFAIVISGPNPVGGNYNNTNIAFVPGTTTPMISVNSINNGTSSGAGPCYNCSYYVDNTNGTSIAYDGFTSGLQGQVQVAIGQTYHLKIAIADAGDGFYDSCVMFLANSFKSIPTIPTGILETEKESNLLIFPNPTSSSIVHIEVMDDFVQTLELYSYQGKLIENITFDKNTNTIQLSNTAKGIYFLHVNTDKGKVVKKLVIN